MTVDSPFMLLVIGLVTVFAVLLLIIGFGNLLIRAVNRFFPEEVKKTNTSCNTAVDPSIRQAIEIAIRQISKGKSCVQSIEKN